MSESLPIKIGFLASGRGTNMQTVIDACQVGTLAMTPAVVISNKSTSGAIERAKQAGIPHYHLSGKTHPIPEQLDLAIVNTLQKHQVSLVVLVGYMKKIGEQTLKTYHRKIINIHPSLLPKHGGKGMFGRHVHEAVLAAGETETGVTIHLIDEEYDTGPILAQSRISIQGETTVDAIAAKVLQEEHRFLVETLCNIASGTIQL